MAVRGESDFLTSEWMDPSPMSSSLSSDSPARGEALTLPQHVVRYRSDAAHSNEGTSYHDQGEFDETTKGRRNNKQTIIRVILAVLLTALIITLIIDSFTNNHVRRFAIGFLEWVEQHPLLGVLAVILVYAIATVLFVPGSILTVGCGFAFRVAFGTVKGVALASTAVFFGASLGAISAFLLGRYLLRGCVTQMTAKYPIFKAIDRAMQGNGFKIMVLLRLSPLIPFNALEYMSGGTAIPLWSFALSLVAIIPGVVTFTFIGSTFSSLADSENFMDQNQTIKITSIILGIVFAVAGVIVASYYAKKELDKILDTDGQDVWQSRTRLSVGVDGAREELVSRDFVFA